VVGLELSQGRLGHGACLAVDLAGAVAEIDQPGLRPADPIIVSIRQGVQVADEDGSGQLPDSHFRASDVGRDLLFQDTFSVERRNSLGLDLGIKTLSPG
jgi:hypothetical protein